MNQPPQVPGAAPDAAAIAALPISEHRERIVRLIAEHPVLVLAGETGSGKSTQLPRYCLESGRGQLGRIAHTQPRRLAARALAARIAAERGEAVGATVGFRVRFADEVSEQSRLILMTDGLLLAEVARDPELRRYDTLIIDEAHERSLNIDLLLGVAKRVLAVRPEFRLIIASATLDVARVAEFFGGAPVLEVGGRMHAVEVRYRPPLDADEEETDLPSNIAAAYREILEDPGEGGHGDVLVFLPGEREIRDVGEVLAKEIPPDTEVLPLYSRLAWEQQRRIFDAGTRRRVILCTNVAETSITVPRVRFVIDSGLARVSRYSPSSRMQRLPIEPVPRASAEQRKGRCGRVGPGVCVRLYSLEDFESRPAFAEPEVLRTNLSALLLRLAADDLGNAEEFPFLDPPDRRALNDGYRTLMELGALDEERRITARGRAIARLPLDPRLGRAVLESKRFRAVSELLAIASGLSVPDPVIRVPVGANQAAEGAAAPTPTESPGMDDQRSEFSSMVRLWRAYRGARKRSRRELRQWCKERRLSLLRLSEWEDVYHQLVDRAREIGIHETNGVASYTAVHRSLLAGFTSQVGVHEGRGTYLGVRGLKFSIFPGSPLKRRQPRWLLAANIVETTRVFARTVAQIEPSWIEPAARHLIKREYFDADWSEAREQVVARERVTLLGLTLASGRQVNFGPVSPEESRRIFAREAIVFRRMRRRPDWLARNDAQLDEARRVEDRLRVRGLLASSESLAEHYERVLPRQVSSADALEAWTRRLSPAEIDALTLAPEMLFLRLPDPDALAQFPEHIRLHGHELHISYRFDPDRDDDGATIHVPLLLAPALSRASLDHAVPGFERLRTESWMRALPKHARRSLIPIPESVHAFFDARAGDATLDLADWLQQGRGVDVQDIAVARRSLPAYLTPLIVIEDAERRMAGGRDWTALRCNAMPRAHIALQEIASVMFPAPWRRFEQPALPDSLSIAISSGALTLYPALTRTDESLMVRLYLSAEEAAHAHAEGIAALARHVLAAQSKDLARRLSTDTMLLLSVSAHARAGEFSDALLQQVFAQALGGAAGALRDRAGFEAALLAGRENLYPTFDRLVEFTRQLFKSAAEVRMLVAQAPVAEELKLEANSHLQELLQPSRWQAVDAARWQQWPRFLKAAQVRWRRLNTRAVEAPGVLLELQRWRAEARRLEAAYLQQHRWSEPLQHFGSMVEEYRASLSAQELKTAEPVSEPRLRARLAAAQAWLDR